MTLLEPTGLTFDCAANGRIAVDKFRQNPEKYAVILMDVQMPVMDGYEAARLIRADDDPHGAKIPIIAMTANAFKDDIERSAASGMDAHLCKPIEIDRVLECLRTYINTSDRLTSSRRILAPQLVPHPAPHPAP
jgi:CheY-like chemotaxis protein